MFAKRLSLATQNTPRRTSLDLDAHFCPDTPLRLKKDRVEGSPPSHFPRGGETPGRRHTGLSQSAFSPGRALGKRESEKRFSHSRNVSVKRAPLRSRTLETTAWRMLSYAFKAEGGPSCFDAAGPCKTWCKFRRVTGPRISAPVPFTSYFLGSNFAESSYTVSVWREISETRQHERTVTG